MSKYDVLIVGSGPAGAMTAYWLATAGAKVAIIEKSRLPRYKACGGGISGRTRGLIPFDIAPVIEREVRGINFSYLAGASVAKRHPKPFAYMVMRDRFDALLTQEACRAGAALYEGFAVHAVDENGTAVRVQSSQGQLSGSFLVGADGANSVVSRSLRLLEGAPAFVALEHELAPLKLDKDQVWPDVVDIDFWQTSWGYRWVFPKGDHLSVGVAVVPSQARTLKPRLAEYGGALGLGPTQLLRSEGHLIRFRPEGTPLQRGRALLVGDAAGMADEFSAEGIFYAIWGARLAAEVLLEALKRNDADLSSYEVAVDRELVPELKAARAISRFFFGALRRSPGLLFQVIQHVEYHSRTLFRVQAGELSYREVLRRWFFLAPLWRRWERGSIAGESK